MRTRNCCLRQTVPEPDSSWQKRLARHEVQAMSQNGNSLDQVDLATAIEEVLEKIHR
jgi:hypothetical protein